MSKRKPLNVSWQSWIDGQIEHDRREGKLSALPGAGKPIAELDQPYDEMWWVKKFMRREGVDFLPEALRLRRENERAHQLLPTLRSERDVRRFVEELNKRIKHVNLNHHQGPPSNVMPWTLDETLERWRTARPEPSPAPAHTPPQNTAADPTVLTGIIIMGLALATIAFFIFRALPT